MHLVAQARPRPPATAREKIARMLTSEGTAWKLIGFTDDDVGGYDHKDVDDDNS